MVGEQGPVGGVEVSKTAEAYKSAEFRAILRSPEVRKGLLGLNKIRTEAIESYRNFKTKELGGTAEEVQVYEVQVYKERYDSNMIAYADSMWEIIDEKGA